MARSFVLAAGLLLCAAIASLPRSAGAADPAVPRVAVVDVIEAMKASPRRLVLDADLQKAMQDVEAFAREQQKRLDADKNALVNLPKADPSWKQRDRDLRKANHDAQFEIDMRKLDAERVYMEGLKNLYLDVRQEIRRVATDLGYAIVVNKTEDDLAMKSREAFFGDVMNRSVLAYDTTVDLTKAVKDRLMQRATSPAGVMPPPGPSAVPPPGPAPGGTLPPPRTVPGGR